MQVLLQKVQILLCGIPPDPVTALLFMLEQASQPGSYRPLWPRLASLLCLRPVGAMVLGDSAAIAVYYLSRHTYNSCSRTPVAPNGPGRRQLAGAVP